MSRETAIICCACSPMGDTSTSHHLGVPFSGAISSEMSSYSVNALATASLLIVCCQSPKRMPLFVFFYNENQFPFVKDHSSSYIEVVPLYLVSSNNRGYFLSTMNTSVASICWRDFKLSVISLEFATIPVTAGLFNALVKTVSIHLHSPLWSLKRLLCLLLVLYPN
jgi:hypothetical protein